MEALGAGLPEGLVLDFAGPDWNTTAAEATFNGQFVVKSTGLYLDQICDATQTGLTTARTGIFSADYYHDITANFSTGSGRVNASRVLGAKANM